MKKTQNQPLISIIVPAYNVEKFIGKCIESILAQTYQNFELIIVDDGSTDFTPEIIKLFANKNSKIKYFTQENTGVSAARNLGLDKTKGEYIMFVDGDDYIEPDTLEDSLAHLQKHNADVCIFNHQTIAWKNSKRYETPSSDVLDFEGYVCDAPKAFFDRMPVVWGKLFKNDDRLPHFNTSLKKGEDTLFLWEYYLSGAKIVFLNKVYYNYVQHQASCVHQADLLENAYNIMSADCTSKLFQFQRAPSMVKAYILNRYAQACINEVNRFYKNKKWPKSYRKAVGRFLIEHYSKELSFLPSYDDLRRLYLKQVFSFMDKIYKKEIEGDVETTTIFGVKFKRKITLKEVEDIYVKFLKKNKDKYEHDTYLLSDCLYEQAECIDAYSLFLYMRSRGMKAYYVILKSNPLYEKLLREGNIENIIVLPDTTKRICFYHFTYDILLKTKAIISSFGSHTINQDFFVHNAYWKYIFIQHGETFLKESVFWTGYFERCKYDKILISSSLEKRLFQQYDFKNEDLIECALPRWDLLPVKSAKKKKILVMFTWRRAPKENFDKSFYKKKILSLLQNEELDRFLQAHGIELYFALHHALFGARKIDFKTGYKHVVPINQVSEYIKECSLLITDFSSVAFDFMFQNKPVLFYLLDYNDPSLFYTDRKDMEQMHYKKYFIGNVFYNWNDTFEKLKYYVKHNFALEKELKEKYAKFFYYKKDIRKRLTDEIERICNEESNRNKCR